MPHVLLDSLRRRFGEASFMLLAAFAALPVDAAGDAASAVSMSQERALIAAERTAVEARFTSRERECSDHFVVTSCVDAAKRARREALDRLRARQLVVDAARRHERADERRKELSDKAAEDASRDSASASGSAARSASQAASAATGAPSLGLRAGTGSPRVASGAAGSGIGRDRTRAADRSNAPKAHPAESPQARKDRETKSREAFDKRRMEAEEHRAQSMDRAARRTASKAPAASLPLPGASAASATSR